MSRRLMISGVLVFAFASSAAAQSLVEPNLAEIARQAEAAKPTAPKAKKSYTNADLSNGGLPPAPEPAAGFMSASLGKPVSAEEMLKLSEAKAAAEQQQKQPEEYWVGQANLVRRGVDKILPRLAELKARPKNPNANLQKRAVDEAVMLQQQLESLRKRWAGIEDAARTAKINLAWISPPPNFPQ